MLDIAALALVATALLAYVNHRFFKLPTSIGVMAGALALSLAMIGLDALGVGHNLLIYEQALLRSLDFSTVLMQGMLSLLLFAGALHIDLRVLRSYRLQVGALAVVGTLLSTFAIGLAVWWLLPLTGVQLPLLHCLLFGALISPTDPIAVMGILKTSGAPKELELVVAGESLFNDGVGVVVFTLLLGVLASGAPPTPVEGLAVVLREAGGGLLFGLALGYVTFRLIKSVDNYQLEVLLTLAAVIGGYSFAALIDVSGPLAMVVAGLIIGNCGRALAMSRTTRGYLDMFWELLAAILNAVLFVLIGMEVLLVVFTADLWVAGAMAVVVTLAARLITAGLPAAVFSRWFRLPSGSWKILTWGGLRGGISVALALSLPKGPGADTVLALTYCVVVFSILVQGLSSRSVTRSALGRDRGKSGPREAEMRQ
ncbi:MAG: sodium:proton antiporter [Alphaproteobacteria bacterium]|nr:sodium:proton antiporter [Alphaproteobacteria bacterium]